MGEIKISASDKLDGILQKKADELGLKKAEFVKHIIVNSLMEEKENHGKK